MVKRIARILVITGLVFSLFLLTVVPVLAFDARSGNNVTIGSGEVINSDLYAAGSSITIDGTVNGDVFAMGQTITINGTVNGGITLAAQSITINGKISAGARIAGQTITIGGSIGRDLIVACSDVTINQNAVIAGDLGLATGTASLNGKITGNVTGSANSLTINNRIDKSVDITVQNLILSSTANIGGNLRYVSNNEANIQQGAVIAGTTSRELPSEKPGREKGLAAGILGWVLLRIFGFIAAFIIGIVLIFTLFRPVQLLALSIKDYPLSCLGWGALLVFVTPLAALVLILTLVGLPLGIIVLLVWGILLYLSQIPVALLIGWLILTRTRENRSRGFMVGALAIGLLILYVISSIPILGFFIWLLVMIFGMGSLVSVKRLCQPTVIAAPMNE